MAALHADIERLIAAAGLASTIIRPGMFASNALHWWAAAIRDGDVVRWPYGAAETAPIDERDIAAVAARALHEDGHVGGDYVLTGPESLSQAEQVRIIGAVDRAPDPVRGTVAGRVPARDGESPGPGRGCGHAASRVGSDDGAARARDRYRVRRPRIAGANVPSVGPRSRRRVSRTPSELRSLRPAPRVCARRRRVRS